MGHRAELYPGNEDQIERLDETPDTVITLVNGNFYPVSESLEGVIERIAEFQARSRSPEVYSRSAPAGPRVVRPTYSSPGRTPPSTRSSRETDLASLIGIVLALVGVFVGAILKGA